MSSLLATSTSLRGGLPLLALCFPLREFGPFGVSCPRQDNTIIRHYSLQITASLTLEGTSWDDQVQPPCSSRVAQDCPAGFEYLHGYSTTSLGNLCQCLTTFTVKKCFNVFRWNFMVCSFASVLAVPNCEWFWRFEAVNSLPYFSNSSKSWFFFKAQLGHYEWFVATLKAQSL